MWWFTWAKDGAWHGIVEVYDTLEETVAKYYEALPKSVHISPVEEHIGTDGLECAQKAALFWAKKGAYGRPRLPGDKR